MASEREFWIETTDKTHLYYKVRARSRQEALERFMNSGGEYVGCNDECNEDVRDVLEEQPSIACR